MIISHGRMNPELLRTFLAVCRHRSFTRAAEERFLTQPAVSRQMKQLEERLGLRLFEKLGKTVDLTEAGRALQRHAEDLVGRTDRLVELVRSYGAGERGHLRIGASSTPGYYLL